MKIVHVIPGSGDSFYCENCLRDAGLARALGGMGHQAVVVPLYLPLGAEAMSPAVAEEVFFGGVNVYLQQKLGLFRRTPRWLDRAFDARWLLRAVGKLAGATSAKVLGQTTLSMLRGEEGRQVKELDRLVDFLAGEGAPDVVVLSNALLLGLARRMKQSLGSAVVCVLQDEDFFLDGIVEPYRQQAWAELTDRAADVDAFIAVSEYYAGVMTDRLGVPAEKVHVCYSGIHVADFSPAPEPPTAPTVGFLSRVCRAKGADALVEAFLLLRKTPELAGAKLRLAGGWTGEDAKFVKRLRRRLDEAGAAGDAEVSGLLERDDRLAFLRSLSVLSVPAPRGEAFGMYMIEAMACGVPVVQPRAGAFEEIVSAAGGGIIVEPADPAALAEGLRKVLLDADLAASLAAAGRAAAAEKFSIERMAGDVAEVFRRVAPAKAGSEHGGH